MIKVDDNYIIDIDAYNYIPRIKVERTNKATGEQYDDYVTIGFYSSLPQALQGIIRHNVANSLSVGINTLEDALKCVQTSNKELCELLERVWDDGK